MWSRRAFLATASGTALSGAVPPAKRTNVVMIMTDDHGAWSLGSYGNSDAHTPILDRLALDGARFTRVFAVAAVCSPSRASYITGKIPSQHGVQDYILGEETVGPDAKRFLAGHTTYSEILARHGYRLGYFGKWHIGDDATAQAGFHEWFATAGGTYRTTRVYRKDRPEEIQGYRTDVITGRVLDFLDANSSRPFFIQVGYNAPHTPYDYQPEEYRGPYLESKFPAFPDLPPHPNQIRSYRQYLGQRESRLSYMALVRGVDQNVGRIVDKLRELELRENTLVIFCADQGFNCGHHGVWGKGNGTLPFNMYDETLRVPMIFNHPGTIRSGQVVDPMVSTLDFFPTLLDYLGLPPHGDESLAGRSFAGFLRGRPRRWENRVFAEYAYVRTMRSDRLKYVQRADGHPDEMYDLERDPGERKNVALEPAYASQRARLRDEMATWFAARGAPPIDQWRSTVRVKLDPVHYEFNR